MKYIIGISFFLILCVCNSGCLDVLQKGLEDITVIYESHPTKVSYNISYGYNVTCLGEGEHHIRYIVDIPEVLIGSVKILDVLFDKKVTTVSKANNTMILWNITDNNEKYYQLGISSNVVNEGFLISDLQGTNALSIKEIETIYPHLVQQYCQPQGNETVTFINPDHPAIKETAESIGEQLQSNNSFLVAKELFKWLKKHTQYQTHEELEVIQPAHLTYAKKTGDCDDLSFLYISLCRSINLPARFIRGFLIENHDGIAQAVSHVWVEVFVGGGIGNQGWVPVECAGNGEINAEIHQNFGVEDAYHLRLFIDDGSNESIETTFSNMWIQYDQGVTVEVEPFVNIIDYTVLRSQELWVENEKRMYH